MPRRQFTTTIDVAIQDKFRELCKEKEQKMNDVIEVFMKSYTDDNIIVRKEMTYIIKN
ncbi:hypothetical protein [uncultured Clostridium sp.]|jgi:hypothetical protein|uniref:hypothetical protein n=1 Tax=uncultured Clostridium sp. TaxID=59620 RepID=UPI0026258F0B|nr:hypothetical protein [uncultured Clostridium sp.]